MFQTMCFRSSPLQGRIGVSGLVKTWLFCVCLLHAKIRYSCETDIKTFFIVREKHGYESGKDRVVMWVGHALVAPI